MKRRIKEYQRECQNGWNNFPAQGVWGTLFLSCQSRAVVIQTHTVSIKVKNVLTRNKCQKMRFFLPLLFLFLFFEFFLHVLKEESGNKRKANFLPIGRGIMNYLKFCCGRPPRIFRKATTRCLPTLCKCYWKNVGAKSPLPKSKETKRYVSKDLIVNKKLQNATSGETRIVIYQGVEDLEWADFLHTPHFYRGQNSRMIHHTPNGPLETVIIGRALKPKSSDLQSISFYHQGRNANLAMSPFIGKEKSKKRLKELPSSGEWHAGTIESDRFPNGERFACSSSISIFLL